MDHLLPLTSRTLDEVLMEFTILWKLIASSVVQQCKGKKEKFGIFFFDLVAIFCCCAINPRCFLQFPVHIFQDGTLWPLPMLLWHACANPSISWCPPCLLSYWTICVVSYRFLSPLLSRDFQLIACLVSFAVGCRMSLQQDWWNTKATQSKDFFQEIRK